MAIETIRKQLLSWANVFPKKSMGPIGFFSWLFSISKRIGIVAYLGPKFWIYRNQNPRQVLAARNNEQKYSPPRNFLAKKIRALFFKSSLVKNTRTLGLCFLTLNNLTVIQYMMHFSTIVDSAAAHQPPATRGSVTKWIATKTVYGLD